MPKAINNPRITASMQKAFNFKGKYIPMLDEVVVPVYQIDDPVPALPAKTFAGRFIVPGATSAGNFPQIIFNNPAGTGTLMMITQVSFGLTDSIPQPLAGEDFKYTAIIAGATTPTANVPTAPVNRDTRNAGKSVIQISTGETSASADGFAALAQAILNSTTGVSSLVGGPGPGLPRNPPIIIRPDRQLKMLASGALADGATALKSFVNLAWTEIPEGGIDTPT